MIGLSTKRGDKYPRSHVNPSVSDSPGTRSVTGKIFICERDKDSVCVCVCVCARVRVHACETERSKKVSLPLVLPINSKEFNHFRSYICFLAWKSFLRRQEEIASKSYVKNEHLYNLNKTWDLSYNLVTTVINTILYI